MGEAEVYVPEDQFSLAIGRGGQNSRLAVRLTGYKIDIKLVGPDGEEIEREEKKPKNALEERENIKEEENNEPVESDNPEKDEEIEKGNDESKEEREKSGEKPEEAVVEEK